MLRALPDQAHYPVDPERLDLVEEFRRCPLGPHGNELQKLVHRLRWQAEHPRYALMVDEPGRLWMLARMPARHGEPVQPVPEMTFTSVAAAEWEVFRRRWEAATGRKIPI